ncbi:hypothetical protein BCR34DRAFT_607239 [Clohesyomyces aquaticus]|uniref:Uncharacterized protein n=1 Tax=Clohesyomyces aquaticus TaxID=1231657 RepID=A0A1Y1YHP7_9PLEO|nr:hypothetical protein BCR34DRAFT_607239 [Clohesyomyces aquaticus]
MEKNNRDQDSSIACLLIEKMTSFVLLLAVLVVALNHVTAAPLVEDVKRYITPNGTEVFDPRPHGETPVYSRSRWPRTLTVKRDNSPTECTEFPDKLGISVEYMYSASNYTVYCWQNSTVYDPAGTIYVRAVQDCYVDEKDLVAEGIDFQERLPWCGPVKPPYMVMVGIPLWNSTASDTAHYTNPCWREPTTKSTQLETAATGFHLTCWVEGDMYGNSTRWYESARLEDYKKCYFPEDYFYEKNQAPGTFPQMPGSGDRCPT